MNKSKPLLMGILNVTPDSFSDGGRFFSLEDAVRHGLSLASDGADILDIGGESTGPGSSFVDEKEEIQRVIPVIRELSKLLPEKCVLSIDTYKSKVAEKAISTGAKIVNDVTALRGDPKMAEIIQKTGVRVVLMYSKDSTPRTTSDEVQYKDVVSHIMTFLQERVEFALSQGIQKEQIILDPGMGAFISGDEKYSLEVLRRLREFQMGFPVLIGASRKGFIGKLMGGASPSERIPGSLACAAAACYNGADILRVHDVKETRQFFALSFLTGNPEGVLQIRNL